MSLHEFTFSSSNGKDKVCAWGYTPLGHPQGVVQIIHGFGEHSRRYTHFIEHFLDAGFAVYADDHIGHGKTGITNGTLGNPRTKDFLDYVKDEKSLHDFAMKAHPNVPFLLFGHSWGSLIARAYVALYGSDVKALTLCGVVSEMKGAEFALKNKAFRTDCENHPQQPAGQWMAEIFKDMTARIEQPRTANDWIANDPRIVEDHAHDPLNSFDVTLCLLRDFVDIYRFVEAKDWMSKVPHDLPIYLIAGDQDPCGNYGEGVYHLANRLLENHHPAQVKIYAGYRHEIHNEREIRDAVEESVIQFFKEQLKKD